MKLNDEAGVAVQLQLSAKSEDIGKGKGESVFETTYKKHTVFDKEPIQKSYIKHKFNELIVFTVSSQDYDMISDLYLKINLPNIEAYNSKWTNTIGHCIIDNISIVNNDVELINFTGESLHLHFLLDTPKTKLNAHREMIKHYHCENSLSGKGQILYVEIPFLKSVLDKQYFPLLLTKHNEFQIRVKFQPITKVTKIDRDQHMKVTLNQLENNQIKVNFLLNDDEIVKDRNEIYLYTSLFFDAYYLTNEEKMLFKHKESFIIYKTIQQRSVNLDMKTSKKTIDLNFTGNVSELIFCLKSLSDDITNRPFTYYPIKHTTLTLNGKVRDIEKVDPKKYNISQRHTNIPYKHVYVIPFCLSSKQTQPSGHYYFNGARGRNFLTIDQSILKQNQTCELSVYAIVYESSQFKDGHFVH